MIELESVCPLTTGEVLRRAALVAPDLEAVVGPESRMSYRELENAALGIRRALEATGVRRGDRVAICLGNSPEWMALFYAISALGAVVVPINTRLKPREIGYALEQAEVSTLFLADRFLKIDFVDMLRTIIPEIDDADRDPEAGALPRLRSVIVMGEDVPPAAVSYADFLAAGVEAEITQFAEPEDVALIQYTSGTTALPKGVLLRHRSMTANGFFSGARIGLRPGDRFQTARPFFHVAGTTLSIIAAGQHLTTLIVMERFEPGEALRLMEEERCTHFSGNDTLALMLLGHPDASTRSLQLRGAWLAASPAIVERVIDELGATEAVVGYGLSEASPNVAQGAWWEDRAVRVSGAMLPQPGVEVRICGEDGPCPSGVVGEIQVRGWNVMVGYDRMPERTAETLVDGWLHTGDLGMLDAEGRLRFTGRLKEIIRVGGENVSPGEIEDVLHRHPGISQAVVVGVPDERLVEVPFAFIERATGASLQPNEIAAWAKQELAGFKVPHHVRILDDISEIGLTASGKVPKKDAERLARRLIGVE